MRSDCLPPSLIEDVRASVTRKIIKSWLSLNLLVNDIINYALSGVNTSFLSLRRGRSLPAADPESKQDVTVDLLAITHNCHTAEWTHTHQHAHTHTNTHTNTSPHKHTHINTHTRHTHTTHTHTHTHMAHTRNTQAISSLEMFWCILKSQSEHHIMSGILSLEGHYFF